MDQTCCGGHWGHKLVRKLHQRNPSYQGQVQVCSHSLANRGEEGGVKRLKFKVQVKVQESNLQAMVVILESVKRKEKRVIKVKLAHSGLIGTPHLKCRFLY